jgi:hypothetical protein
LSDIATSCEYHTPEATCLAVAENQKAQTNRQQRCKNDQKYSCCYTCNQRHDCTISCKYLGTIENQPKPPETQKIQPDNPTSEPKSPIVSTAKYLPVAYCTSCNVEMTPKKAKLRIHPEDNKQFGEYTPQAEDNLPVIIYLCPLCGRIEFRAVK